MAGANYGGSGLRRFIGGNVFNAVLIDRTRTDAASDPVGQMAPALRQGSSLILFPERTRNLTDGDLLPFRSGL